MIGSHIGALPVKDGVVGLAYVPMRTARKEFAMFGIILKILGALMGLYFAVLIVEGIVAFFQLLFEKPGTRHVDYTYARSANTNNRRSHEKKEDYYDSYYYRNLRYSENMNQYLDQGYSREEARQMCEDAGLDHPYR